MDYDESIAFRVCDAIAETPKGLTYILGSDDSFPDRKSWFKWLADSEELRNRYARAKELQGELLFEECLDIGDDSSGDTKLVGKEGEEHEICNSEFVQRSRLRIDTRKWMLAKLNPKKYGDRITQEHTGEDGGPIRTVSREMSEEEAARSYKELMG